MNKIKMTLACMALTASAALTASSQTNTPYSMYGYGILGDRATSMQRQMGGVGYAMQNGRQINVMNPASYAAIDSLTFLFDMGANATFVWSKEGDTKENSKGGGLDYVTMQFPLSKYIGASVGLVPVSSVGYAFGNEIHHGTMSNQGSGGINELYLGVGGKYRGFSLGVNFSYDFGTIVNDVYATPINSSNQNKTEHVMRVRDWNVLIGAQYTHPINRDNKMTVGVTYSPKKSLRGKSWVTTQVTNLDQAPDTLSYIKLKDNYEMPTTIGVGLSFAHERVSRWAVEVDYTWQGWKGCKYSQMVDNFGPNPTGQVVFQGMEFNNRQRFAVGGEYTPRIRGNYGQRMVYRLGAYYTDDYLRIQGNDLREYGVTCGFGFPTAEGKTMVNLGFEWKCRQAHPSALIKENYVGINLGVNFNEVWFFKRKIR